VRELVGPRVCPIDRAVGLFDFFTGKGGGVTKHVNAANNKYAQSPDRWRSLEKLRDDAGEEALAGLLRRFTWNYDKSIEDEQEKEAVHDWLVEMATHQVKEDDPADVAEVKRSQRAIVLKALGRSL